VRNFSPWASSVTEDTKETKLDTKVAYGCGWCPNFEYTNSTEKARDTTCDDEK